MTIRMILRRLAACAAASAMLLSGASLLPADAASEMPDFSEFGAVGCLTRAQTQAAAESIYTAISSHSGTAALPTSSGLLIQTGTEEMDSLLLVFATVVGGYEQGILTNKNSISLQMASSSRKCTYFKSIVIYYLADDSSYSKEYSEAIGKLDAISAQVQPSWSSVEKALFLHDYLAVHYDYDRSYDDYATESEQYLCHTAYGMLKRGKAVCEAYSWLYNLLLRREGIDSYMVLSDSLGHAWNLVSIDGEWAHVDITWDDCYQEHSGIVLHDSFLKSSAEMQKSEHTSNDWMLSTGTPVSSLSVTDRFDNGFWSGSRSAVTYYQDRWLVIVPDAKDISVGWFRLFDYDPETATASGEDILSASHFWTVPGSTDYYPGTYITTAAAGNVLYYSTPRSILALSDGEVCWQLDLTNEQASKYRIYGIYIEGETLWYSLSDSPVGNVVKCSMTLPSLGEGSAEAATEPVTEAPTEPVTEAPTEPAAEAPTEAVTEAPTEPAAEAPTESVTAEPTEPATEAPTEPATEAPTEPMTEAPTEPLTEIETSPITETSTEPLTGTPEVQITVSLEGDLDGDGVLTVTDVIALQRYLLGELPFSQETVICADLIEDGTVDVFDLVMMKRLLITISS